MIGSAIGVEFADPWSKIDQYAKRKEACNRVDKSCSTKIVKASRDEIISYVDSYCLSTC